MQDLGLVDVDNYSTSGDAGGQVIIGPGTRDVIYVQGVPDRGARAARGFIAFGGTVGPYSIIAGVAINALNVSSVVWAMG